MTYYADKKSLQKNIGTITSVLYKLCGCHGLLSTRTDG